jgi:hypothetical protein
LLLTGCVVNTDWPERASWPWKLAQTGPNIMPPVTKAAVASPKAMVSAVQAVVQPVTNPPVALILPLTYPAAGTNKFYFIQFTTSLTNPKWQDYDGPFTTTIPPCGGENITNNGAQQYFRTCCR